MVLSLSPSLINSCSERLNLAQNGILADGRNAGTPKITDSSLLLGSVSSFRWYKTSWNKFILISYPVFNNGDNVKVTDKLLPLSAAITSWCFVEAVVSSTSFRCHASFVQQLFPATFIIAEFELIVNCWPSEQLAWCPLVRLYFKRLSHIVLWIRGAFFC